MEELRNELIKELEEIKRLLKNNELQPERVLLDELELSSMNIICRFDSVMDNYDKLLERLKHAESERFVTYTHYGTKMR